MKRVIHHTKRVAIGIVGGAVVVVGIILIPYPGPGWLTVFAGLAILATEFDAAERILMRARYRYDQWTAWLARQSLWVRSVTFLFTALVVVVTVWLVNGFGVINSVLQLNLAWLQSPFLR